MYSLELTLVEQLNSIEDLKSENDELVCSLESKTKKITNLEKLLENNSNLVQGTKEELEKTKVQLASEQFSLEESRQEKILIEQSLKASVSDLEELRTQIQMQLSEKKVLEDTICELQGLLNVATKRADNTISEVEKLIRDLTQRDELLTKEQANTEYLSSLLAEKNLELVVLRQKTEELTTKLTGLEKDKDSFEKQTIERRKQCEILEIELTKLKKNYDDITQESSNKFQIL